MTESPSFSAGDNPPVLFSSDFRISGAPEKYEVRARAMWLQASCRTWMSRTLGAWEGPERPSTRGEARLLRKEKDKERRAGLDMAWEGCLG